jgi:redox-sensitive bicupin YhaK (pirin superfamily)
MGFRALRVINEDVVQGGQGFGTHPHRDMEIVTYVLEGSLAHRDSMGTEAQITAGEVQRMTAGTGVTHSEYNASPSQPVHLLQIWVLPERNGLTPGYEQHRLPETAAGGSEAAAGGPGSAAGASPGSEGGLILVASPDAAEGSLLIHQDVRLFVVRPPVASGLRYSLAGGRHAYVQVTRGALDLNGTRLGQGDGAAVSDESVLAFSAQALAEALLFDLV